MRGEIEITDKELEDLIREHVQKSIGATFRATTVHKSYSYHSWKVDVVDAKAMLEEKEAEAARRVREEKAMLDEKVEATIGCVPPLTSAADF